MGLGLLDFLRLLTTTHGNLCTFVAYRYEVFLLGCCGISHEARYFCVLNVVICMQELMRDLSCGLLVAGKRGFQQVDPRRLISTAHGALAFVASR